MALRRSLDWVIPAVLAVLASLALTAGFALAITGRFGAPLAPLPPKAEDRTAGGAFRIVALGDSITEGTGDVLGGGYAARVAESLRRRGLVIIFTNLATAGAESDDVLAAARSPEARRQLEKADLILVSAGGNDLSHSLRAMTGEETREPELALGRARENLGQLVRTLRAMNPGASVRLVGIYNPFEITVEDAPRARAQLAEWNAVIEQVTQNHAGVLAVPIADIFYARPDRLAGDRYHPGPRGHDLIADRVLSTLRQGDLAVR